MASVRFGVITSLQIHTLVKLFDKRPLCTSSIMGRSKLNIEAAGQRVSASSRLTAVPLTVSVAHLALTKRHVITLSSLSDHL